MKTKLFPAVIFSLLLAFTACKNDPKDPDHPDGKPPVVEEKAKPSSEMTPEKRFVLNSVMTKAIVTHESKTFSSMLLTVGLNDTLATSDGPYTLLAPNSKVFKNMEKEKMRFLTHIENADSLKAVISSHVIPGKIGSADMVKNIKAGNGTYRFKAITGAALEATMKGSQIIIKDAHGNTARVGKSDILAQNGTLHILDALLHVN